MYVVILAGSPTEAQRYTRATNLPRGRFRYAAQASTIRGLRVAEIHELPGFAKRPDRHAINAVLRFVKGARVQVSDDEFADLLAAAGQRRTALPLEKALEVAYRYVAIQEANSGQSTGEAEPSEDVAPAPQPEEPTPAPAPKPPRQRTRKAAEPAPAAPQDLF